MADNVRVPALQSRRELACEREQDPSANSAEPLQSLIGAGGNAVVK